MIQYLNLTNGLDFASTVGDFRFTRIQSSHCESHAHNAMFSTLDSDLLMHLALGHECEILDASPGSRAPKSLRLGVPIICYVLERLWFGRAIEVAGVDSAYLDRVYNSLSSDTKRRLRYFGRFAVGHILLTYRYSRTTHDGDYDHYRGVAIARCG